MMNIHTPSDTQPVPILRGVLQFAFSIYLLWNSCIGGGDVHNLVCQKSGYAGFQTLLTVKFAILVTIFQGIFSFLLHQIPFAVDKMRILDNACIVLSISTWTIGVMSDATLTSNSAAALTTNSAAAATTIAILRILVVSVVSMCSMAIFGERSLPFKVTLVCLLFPTAIWCTEAAIPLGRRMIIITSILVLVFGMYTMLFLFPRTGK